MTTEVKIGERTITADYGVNYTKIEGGLSLEVKDWGRGGYTIYGCFLPFGLGVFGKETRVNVEKPEATLKIGDIQAKVCFTPSEPLRLRRIIE